MTGNKSTVTTEEEITRKIERVANLNETEITITKTKLENCLIKHKEVLESGSDWKTPLGLMLTLILVFLTTEFSIDFLGVSRHTWKAIFLILLCGSVVWLLISGCKRYQNRNIDTDYLIRRIMGKKKKN